jgi:alpha-D-ribose 1-methylphosphonate 5-triphosphate synthase subunit PhnH
MTLDGMLHESLPPRSQASAAEAALPTVLDHLTDVLLSNNFSSKEYATWCTTCHSACGAVSIL